MKKYDVIIVGAGPAGSAVAETVASKGDKEVLLIDRKSELGRNYYCAGGLSTPWIERANIEVPKKIILSEIKNFRMFSPNSVAELPAAGFGAENIGYVIDRADFDRMQTEKAVKAGAELRLDARVTGFNQRNDSVEVHMDGECLTTRYLVGADGAGSIIRREAGFPKVPRGEMYCAVQETRKISQPDQADCYFGSRYAPKGYAWVFSAGDEVRVGTAVPLDIGEPRKYLGKFFDDHPEFNGDTTHRTGGLIPLTLPTECVKGNVALVGDAASQVDSLSGAGIGPAIICGRELGKAIVDDNLGAYEENWRRELWGQFNMRYKLKSALCEWPDHKFDTLLDALQGFKPKSDDIPKEVARILWHVSKRSPLLIPGEVLNLFNPLR